MTATDHNRITNAFFQHTITFNSIIVQFNLNIYIYRNLVCWLCVWIKYTLVVFDWSKNFFKFFFALCIKWITMIFVWFVWIACRCSTNDRIFYFFLFIHFNSLICSFFIFFADVTANFRRRLERAKWTK